MTVNRILKPRRAAVLAAAIGSGLLCAHAQELGIQQFGDAQARAQADARAAAPADTVYLAAVVTRASEGRLSVLQSRDGRVFTSLAADAYAPPGGMSDPVIARGADGAWTLTYAKGSGGFAQARSTDLRHWQHVRDLGAAPARDAAFAVDIDKATGRARHAGADLVGLPGALHSVSVTAAPAAAVAQALRPRGTVHTIAWDQYSMKVDGKRVVLWSGEIHPFRLPNPSLWRDVIQKMKALGFNAVSFYFDWAYHSSAPGVYDFSQVRNMERAIEIAEEEGMYIIARPGPYINAELSGGGFPGWMFRNKAEARTDDPVYMAAAEEWLTQINAIIARHQLTDGGGNVIAYQLENELMKVEPKHARMMERIEKKIRADGIKVPVFHNAAGRLPDYSPKGTSAPWANTGPTDMYAFDGYPGGTCDVHADPRGPSRAPDWGIYGQPKPNAGSLTSPATPGFVAEMGSGWFDYWGSNGTYNCTALRQGPGYERVFYGTNLANRLTIHNLYMAFGGTSWGWLPGPIVYTSYDYGAPISEDRGLRPKALALKQQGQFVQAAMPLLAHMDKGPEIKTTNPKVRLYHNVDNETGAHLVFAVHGPSDLTTDDAFSFDLATRDGNYKIDARLAGQDGKLLVAALDVERQRLVYSTSELQAHLPHANGDLVLLQGRTGEAGDTVLRYGSAPKVEVLAGRVESSFDAAKGDLRLRYTHDGLARVRISGGGRAPLLLLVADEATSQRFWLHDTKAGRVLALGPALVRSARLEGNVLALTGDVEADGSLELWGPAFARATFNGAALALAAGNDGARRAATLAGPQAVHLPDLAGLAWQRRADSPEAQPAFDDSAWLKADGRGSAAQTWTQPERGQPTLAMSDYGFHHGDVWYRGHFTVTDPKTNRLELLFGAGGAGLLQAWVDGRFLGQHELDTGRSFPETVDSAHFSLGDLAPGPHVVSVMVRNDSHNWDLMADDQHREARGLIAASLSSRGGQRFGVPIAWRIQGSAGGELPADTARGPLNNGGLYGERAGWHLPVKGGETTDWTPSAPTAAPPAPGTYWLRARVPLDLPRGQDVQLGLQFGDRAHPRSDRENRALIFVNGWNMGQFIAHVGPQRTFVIPPGILNPNGENTIALAVTTDGRAENALEPVKLVVLRNVRGGVPLELQEGAR